jgi:hypothetical protein
MRDRGVVLGTDPAVPSQQQSRETTMTIDLTSELVPILWAMEIFLAVGVAWLFGSYAWQELRGHREFSRPATTLRVVPKPPVPLNSKVSEHTLAA